MTMIDNLKAKSTGKKSNRVAVEVDERLDEYEMSWTIRVRFPAKENELEAATTKARRVLRAELYHDYWVLLNDLSRAIYQENMLEARQCIKALERELAL